MSIRIRKKEELSDFERGMVLEYGVFHKLLIYWYVTAKQSSSQDKIKYPENSSCPGYKVLLMPKFRAEWADGLEETERRQ